MTSTVYFPFVFGAKDAKPVIQRQHILWMLLFRRNSGMTSYYWEQVLTQLASGRLLEEAGLGVAVRSLHHRNHVGQVHLVTA